MILLGDLQEEEFALAPAGVMWEVVKAPSSSRRQAYELLEPEVSSWMRLG